MKKKLMKTLLSLVLTASFLLSGAACTKGGETMKTDGTEAASETVGVPDSGKPVLSSLDGSGLSFFLKLNGVEGDSKNKLYDKWIEVTDFTFGMETEYTTEKIMPVKEGRCSLITFTHRVDRATSKLQQLCMSGARITEGELGAAKIVNGSTDKVYSVSFESLRIVSTSVKTMTDENGKSYLLEEVSMTTDSQGMSIVENAQEVPDGGGMRYYVKIDGIEGECTESEYKHRINATGFSHGAYVKELESEIPIYTDGYFTEIVFTHMADSATLGINDCIMRGKIIKSAEVVVTKSIAGKSTAIYKLSLEGIRVAKTEIRSVSDENGNSSIVEEVTFLVEKEAWTYAQVGLDNTASGSVEAEYDQSKRLG